MTVNITIQGTTGHASLLVIDKDYLKLYHTTGSGVETRRDHNQFTELATQQFIRAARVDGFSETAIASAVANQPESKIRGRL